jgi:hypothetical protein
MKVYLGKYRQRERQDVTATHVTLKGLTRRVKGCGHKLYMDNLFSSPDLFDDEENKLLWESLTEYEGHATGSRVQKFKIENG